MNHISSNEPNLLLLSRHEQMLRLKKVREAMSRHGIECGLVSGNANKFYLTGRVFTGYILITPDDITCYVKRPVELLGDEVHYIRKPEDITTTFKQVALELDELPYSHAIRLTKIFGDNAPKNLSPVMVEARAVKTDAEIESLKESGCKQDHVYRQIPSFYRPGMTDLEFQIEIERTSRLEGCLGQFRIAGDSMELFMGNVLAGDNADAPSPYDFAMGGAGMNPSIPVGADGTLIKTGMAVMVDVNGNYTGYMTDMTRVFRVGDLDDLAWKAHRCSIDIHRLIQAEGKPGVKTSDLYEMALELVRRYGLERYYMGHRQHAGFIGHGVGIEINEQPVLAPRSQSVLEERNVIALEPKFVIPHTGAVGIENTYIVRGNGLECITLCNEDILDLL